MAGEVATTAAPTNGAAPGGAQAPAGASGVQTPGAEQPAKTPTLQDELGGILKKYGGLKYKANGREVAVEDPQVLVRRLQNIDGLEASASELLKLKSETQREAELKQRLRAEKNPRERIKILQQLAGDDVSIDDAAEALVLERFEQERQLDKLTPSERKLQQQLEQERSAREKLEGQARRAQEEQEQLQMKEATQHLAKQLFAVTGNALQKVGIKPEHADRYIPEVAAYLRRALELKLPVSADDIVANVVEMRDGQGMDWLGSISDEQLLDRLEKAIEQGADGKPGTSRAKRLANLMAQRTLAKLQQAPNTGTSSIIPSGRAPASQSGGKAPEFDPSYWNTVKR